MSTSEGKFKLRAMEASDSQAVASLITEFGDDITTHFSVDAFAAITSGTEFPTSGVVVEASGQNGLVGMGTVRFNHVQFNGEILPLAFLDGLKVRKDFRRQGLGYKIADWRLQMAKETYGNNCVVATGLLQENTASYAVAKKWCREFLEPAFEALIVPVRRQQPKLMAGIHVCELEPEKYEEFAAKQITINTTIFTH